MSLSKEENDCHQECIRGDWHAVGSSKMAAQRWSLLQSEQQLSWMDGLLLCHLSGVGSASIHSYSTNGKGTESHPHEDNWLKFRSKNNCFLYGVFNSYDGNQAFDVVERSFLESIDDALAKKESLQSQLPEGVPQHQLLPQSVSEDPYVRPQENSGELVPSLERLKALEREISGGAMAIVAALLNKLYVANVGLDAGKFKQVGIICGQENTRHIGDYRVKYGYTDIDLLSVAKAKSIIAEPEIHGAQPLDGITASWC
ncbi:TGF-beta-activated kinase 1 and MAP3K7-binding protein 1 [Cricetulus griseus]|uniref:TGF-beta-activated kinase 1 and MAP3K7-binding protein 1 n=1 Tax=Cricetulus griseus TaxID=10029 RepID=A0A061I3H3_CRIGR|nr:TGF-beta-activated kinase 1 and MAP3K7-binding protein 1 [Cricetulus griseus]